MADSRRLSPPALARSAFAVAGNVLGRTWRHSSKNVNRVRRHLLHRARYSTGGRAMLGVIDAVTSPKDAIQRRKAAVAYNQRHQNPQLDRRDGYAVLTPGSIANSEEVIALSVRLFEEKMRQAEADAATSGK